MTTAVALSEPALNVETPKTEDPALLRAVHTPNFPSLLGSSARHFWSPPTRAENRFRVIAAVGTDLFQCSH
jgi:hypothetical protein